MYVVIQYHDLKKEVAKKVKSSMKTDTVDIFITGPFCNAKAGKSTWIAVFGDDGSAWTLKSQFIKGYIKLCYKVMSLTQLTYSFNPVTGPEGRYVFFAK